MHTKVDSEVALWEVGGRPCRLVGQVAADRYANAGDAAWLPPLVTHAPERRVGWRFSARSEKDATVLTFDVFRSDSGWKLHHVWS